MAEVHILELSDGERSSGPQPGERIMDSLRIASMDRAIAAFDRVRVPEPGELTTLAQEIFDYMLIGHVLKGDPDKPDRSMTN